MENYEVYAARYDTSVRSIKRWVAAGKKAGDACPLDCPGEIADWWDRCMTIRVPDALLAFKVVAAEVGEPQLSAAAPLVAPYVPAVEEMGLEATLNRLRLAEAVSSKSYIDALADANSDDNQVQRLSKRWQECVDSLRRVEKDLIENRRKSGDAISQADLRAVLAPIHNTIVAGLRGFMRRIRPKLASCATEQEQDALWASELDGLFHSLSESDFAFLDDSHPSVAA